MKKHRISMLVLVTCIFASFTAGFFSGRTLNRAPVRITPVPTAASEAIEATQTAAESTAPAIVNINTATAGELQSLPGIGPVLAGRIIDYRNEHGKFQAVEELTKVKGIGESRLRDILDLITAGG